MPRPRPEFVALVCGACAVAAATPLRRLRPLPGDPMRDGWAQARVEAATVALVGALTEDGWGTLQRRRIRDAEVETFLDARGLARARGSVVGLRPRTTERRWGALRRLRGAPVAGWCARGVRVQDVGGVEGFAQSVLTIERILVVLDGTEGRTGFWLEGLVLDDDGWRWLPWVPWSDAVETPRADHTDIGLWACDLERALSRSGSPAR